MNQVGLIRLGDYQKNRFKFPLHQKKQLISWNNDDKKDYKANTISSKTIKRLGLNPGYAKKKIDIFEVTITKIIIEWTL